MKRATKNFLEGESPALKEQTFADRNFYGFTFFVTFLISKKFFKIYLFTIFKN